MIILAAIVQCFAMHRAVDQGRNVVEGNNNSKLIIVHRPSELARSRLVPYAH